MLVNVPTGTLIAALTQAATVLPVATYCDDIAPGNQAVVDVTYGNVTEQITIGQCVNGYPSIIARGTQPRAFPAGSCVTNVIPEAETECPDPIEYTWAMEDGDVNTKYSKCYELPLDEYTLGDTLIPDGFEIDVTGKSLCIWSTALPERLALHPVRAEIWKDNCLFAIVSGALDIVDSCYVTPPCPVEAACFYSWAMTPTTVAVGQPIETSFIAPDGCPSNVTLSLDVFEANGTTPYLVSGQPLVLSIKQGTSEYRPIVSEAGQVLVFKPSAVQQHCLSECQASISSQKRVVLPRVPCTVSWDFQPKTFVAGVSTPITYSATGPAGGRIKLIVYNGNTPIVGVPPLYVPFGTPVMFSNLWRVEDIGEDINWRVAPTGQDPDVEDCAMQPSRIDLDIIAAQPCITSFSLANTTFAAGTEKTQTYTASGIPAGCVLTLGVFVGDTAWSPSGVGQTTISLTRDSPVAGPYSQMWRDVDVGLDFNIRPINVPACLTCVIQSGRVDFDVTPSNAACNVTASISVAACSVTPPSGPIDLTLGACTTNAGLSSQTIMAPGAAGATYQLQESTDTGVTWINYLAYFGPTPSSGIVPPSAILITVSDMISCPTVTRVAGKPGAFHVPFQSSNQMYRFLIDGVVALIP